MSSERPNSSLEILKSNGRFEKIAYPEARYTLDTFDEAAVVNFTDYAVAEIKSTALK